MARRRTLLVALPVLLLLAGCGGASRRTLTVFAAASLTGVFTELGRVFEREHPGTAVRFSFAGSTALLRQLRDGATADVYASADEATMRAAASEVGAPEVFARNQAAILVRVGNPHRIRSAADLDRPGLILVACAPEVPCGKLATALMGSTRPDSVEENVRGVVAKVALGEADAGIGYATDAVGTEGIEAVAVDGGSDPALRPAYPIAVARRARQPALAREWVALLRSVTGRRALRAAGFLLP